MTPRARFAAASVAGGLAAAGVFAWVVFAGRADPLAPETLGAIYDAQARSWLDRRWDLPEYVLSYERFNVGGKFYAYFGPWPALLRLPVVAATHAFDGRLSRLSMIAAFVVLVGFAARLAWQARVVLRGRGPVGWRATSAAAGFTFVVGCGSAALFLGSRVWVYHEAILWAAAWSVAAFSWFVAYLLDRRPRHLILAGVAATLAMSSRASVGLGPVIALGLLLAVQLVQRASDWWSRPRIDERSDARWLGRWLGVDRDAARGPFWLTGLALAAPLAAYIYVNHVKFGTLISVPIDKQDVLLLRPERRASLAATGNTLFGLDYVPTNLAQYLRPDAIGFRGTFPWVTFARAPHVFGGVTFDNIESSASVTAVSTFLAILAIVGVVAAIRRISARSGEPEQGESEQAGQPVPTAAIFRIPLLSAAAPLASTVAIAVLFQRYEGDFVPLLVVGAAAGLFWLAKLLAGRAHWLRVLVIGALIFAAAWSCWATFAITLVYQREYSAFQSPAVRAAFFAFQLDVNDRLGLPQPTVRQGARLPIIRGREFRRTDAPHGQLFVRGNCRGLYIASGRAWETIEERLPGQQLWRVTFGAPTPGVRQPLWSAGKGTRHILWVRWVDAEHVRFEYEWTGALFAVVPGNRNMRVKPGKTYDLMVRIDPSIPWLEVKEGDELLYVSAPSSFDDKRSAMLGRQPDPVRGATTFAGTIRRIGLTPLCDRLTR